MQRVLPCRAHSSAPETTAWLNLCCRCCCPLFCLQLGVSAPSADPLSVLLSPLALAFIPHSTSPNLAFIPVLSPKLPCKLLPLAGRELGRELIAQHINTPAYDTCKNICFCHTASLWPEKTIWFVFSPS